MEKTATDAAKKAAAKAALDFVKPGMTLGLGTGTTTAFFIDLLIEKNRQTPLALKAVATSKASGQQASQGGIDILDPTSIHHIDLTIDGADEVDPNRRMIKGGGGALLREKIIATKSDQLIIIVDESKCVDFLGRHPLPIEVVPYGWSWTQQQLIEMGYPSSPRENREGEFFITDNGNVILDLAIDHPLVNPIEFHHQLISVVGVIETGLFFDLADQVLIGYENGEVRSFP